MLCLKMYDSTIILKLKANNKRHSIFSQCVMKLITSFNLLKLSGGYSLFWVSGNPTIIILLRKPMLIGCVSKEIKSNISDAVPKSGMQPGRRFYLERFRSVL